VTRGDAEQRRAFARRSGPADARDRTPRWQVRAGAACFAERARDRADVPAMSAQRRDQLLVTVDPQSRELGNALHLTMCACADALDLGDSARSTTRPILAVCRACTKITAMATKEADRSGRRVSVRVATETYEQIAKLAKHERRSLAGMIKILLEDVLAATARKGSK